MLSAVRGSISASACCPRAQQARCTRGTPSSYAGWHAKLLANDVDQDAFHRQLGSTGVAQAIGMDTLLTAGYRRELRQERADRAGLQGVNPARPALQNARLFRLADSRERNDSSAVHYTPFSCVLLHGCGFSYGLLNRLEQCLFIEIPRDISALFRAMDPAWTPIEWETFMTQTTAHDLVLSAQNSQ
jgi:hypothetical protein